MESQEVIESFRKQLDQVEGQGGQQVQVSALHAYLNALEKDADASQEYRRQKHEGMLAHYTSQTQHSIEMLKAVLDAGKSALQSLLIINGGAVIALLGVLSNLVGKANGPDFAIRLALPLLLFGIGVLAGAIGFALRYFSQACYSESDGDKDSYEKWGDRFRYSSIAAALTGYALFGTAIMFSYKAVILAYTP
jgi:hypothetical protein